MSESNLIASTMMMNHSSSPPMIPTLATNVSPWLIWATNLDARFTEQSMVDFFMKFAPIVNAGVLRNPIHGRSIRAGWVTLLCDRDTVISALSEVTSCQTGGIRSQWALATFSYAPLGHCFPHPAPALLPTPAQTTFSGSWVPPPPPQTFLTGSSDHGSVTPPTQARWNYGAKKYSVPKSSQFDSHEEHHIASPRSTSWNAPPSEKSLEFESSIGLMENDQAEWLASLVQQTSLEDIQSIATKMPTDIVKDFQVRRLKWAEFEVLVLTQPGMATKFERYAKSFDSVTKMIFTESWPEDKPENLIRIHSHDEHFVQAMLEQWLIHKRTMGQIDPADIDPSDTLHGIGAMRSQRQYKTRICHAWARLNARSQLKSGDKSAQRTCPRGENCKYAHGWSEIRENTLYKTRLCWNYLVFNACEYQEKSVDGCHFAHSINALRPDMGDDESENSKN